MKFIWHLLSLAVKLPRIVGSDDTQSNTSLNVTSPKLWVLPSLTSERKVPTISDINTHTDVFSLWHLPLVSYITSCSQGPRCHLVPGSHTWGQACPPPWMSHTLNRQLPSLRATFRTHFALGSWILCSYCLFKAGFGTRKIWPLSVYFLFTMY